MGLEYHQLREVTRALEEELVVAVSAQLERVWRSLQRLAVQEDLDRLRLDIEWNELLRRTGDRQPKRRT